MSYHLKPSNFSNHQTFVKNSPARSNAKHLLSIHLQSSKRGYYKKACGVGRRLFYNTLVLKTYFILLSE